MADRENFAWDPTMDDPTTGVLPMEPKSTPMVNPEKKTQIGHSHCWILADLHWTNAPNGHLPVQWARDQDKRR